MSDISITINGLQVKAQEGATVLGAAQKAGIYIPTLCHCPDLTPEGVCRICLVKINNKKKLHPDDAEIERVRRVTLELLLSDHDFNCLLCSKSGSCRLQELVNRIGYDESRLNRLNLVAKNLPIDNSNPFFSFNPNKCILCGICVRTCREISGVGAIDMAYRGYNMKVSTFGDKPLKGSVCVSCGECVERCPTAALIPKEELFPTRRVKTICAFCGVGCPVNRGGLCVRGRYGYRFIHSNSRLSSPLVRAYDHLSSSRKIDETENQDKQLTSPLIKQKDRFVEVSWDQVIKYVASTLMHYKGKQFAAFSSARASNSLLFLQQNVRTKKTISSKNLSGQ